MSYPMTLTNPELWRKIESFQIDEGKPSLTFAARLARENGWSDTFAQRVVGEYKKFLYLAVEAGHRVTPSEHVDQAWHLHMLYTSSYWHGLCDQLLGLRLEHTPTKGGDWEDSKFESWYEKTRQAYEREFGSAPPRDIWPDSQTRFGHDLHWKRVNTVDAWVIPKSRGMNALGLFIALIGIAAMLGGGLSGQSLRREVQLGLLIGGGVAFFLAILICAAAKPGTSRSGSRWGSGGSGGCGSSGCGGGGCGGGCGS